MNKIKKMEQRNILTSTSPSNIARKKSIRQSNIAGDLQSGAIAISPDIPDGKSDDEKTTNKNDGEDKPNIPSNQINRRNSKRGVTHNPT